MRARVLRKRWRRGVPSSGEVLPLWFCQCIYLWRRRGVSDGIREGGKNVLALYMHSPPSCEREEEAICYYFCQSVWNGFRATFFDFHA